jgi:mevalonate kinase
MQVRSALGVSRVSADRRVMADDPNRYVVAVAQELWSQGLRWGPSRIVVDSEIPVGRGFSSSAAVCVATATALAQVAGEQVDAVQVAYAAERVRLGISCGLLDPIACAAPGPVLIQWPNAEIQQIPGSPWVLAAALPAPVAAGPLLAALSANRNRPDVAEALSGWGQLAQDAVDDLARHDWAALGAKLNAAQALHDAIPELHAPQLARLRERLPHALGSKFTGAGGDRSLVAVFAGAQERSLGRAWLEAQGLQVVT